MPTDSTMPRSEEFGSAWRSITVLTPRLLSAWMSSMLFGSAPRKKRSSIWPKFLMWTFEKAGFFSEPFAAAATERRVMANSEAARERKGVRPNFISNPPELRKRNLDCRANQVLGGSSATGSNKRRGSLRQGGVPSRPALQLVEQ